MKRIPDGTVLRRDNQWDIPRKRALFISDGPDSTTSGSDIPEGHYDRPPEYSDILISGRPQDESGTEGLCSPSRQLEIAVVRLQKDIDDYRAELELTRTQTPAVAPRPPRRAGFTSTPVPRFSGKSNWEQYRQVFEAIVCSCSLTWTGCTQRCFTGSGVSASGAVIFDKVIIGSQGDWKNTSVSFSGCLGVWGGSVDFCH